MTEYAISQGPDASPLLASEPPVWWKASGTVWHHTTADGLLGILQSHRLWASSPLSMNDTSELRYGDQVLRAAWANLDTSEWTSHQLRFSNETMETDLLALAEASCFLVCATSRKDSLNQWQHYSGAQGYALEIKCAPRLAPVGKQTSAASSPEKIGLFHGWYHVLYEEQHQVAVANSFLGTMKTFADGPPGLPAEGWKRLSQGMLATMIAQCKHPAFADEHEVRYIVSSAYAEAAEKFRVGARGIVPYVELAEDVSSEAVLVTQDPRPLLPIHSLMCGPAAEVEPVLRAARRLLRVHGYDDVDVQRSVVPYRF
jgi:hypothetical protein